MRRAGRGINFPSSTARVLFGMASIQPLGPQSTGEDVINAYGISLAGKNVVVTGASSGIGAEAAR